MHGLVYCLPPKEDISWVGYDQLNDVLSPVVDNRGRYHFAKPVLADLLGLM